MNPRKNTSRPKRSSTGGNSPKQKRQASAKPGPGYLACAFRAGRYSGLWTRASSRAEALRNILDCELADNAAEIVETEIIVRGHYPSGVKKRHKHTYSDVELERPDTLFIGAITLEARRASIAAANVAARQKEKDLQKRIRAVSKLHAKPVSLDELPENLKSRFRCALKGCWIWRTKENPAPYRKFYIQIKGPVPEGAVLRHGCDNRRCVNPNHLTLGSTLDNIRDMVSRKRHPSQMRVR